MAFHLTHGSSVKYIDHQHRWKISIDGESATMENQPVRWRLPADDSFHLSRRSQLPSLIGVLDFSLIVILDSSLIGILNFSHIGALGFSLIGLLLYYVTSWNSHLLANWISHLLAVWISR